MYFEYPKLLWLLVVPALLVLHYIWLELAQRHPHLRVSTAVPWKLRGISFMAVLRHVPFVLRIFALSMIVVAIARPRSSEKIQRVLISFLRWTSRHRCWHETSHLTV